VNADNTTQTMNRAVDTRPLTKLEGALQSRVDDDALNCLEITTTTAALAK